MPYRRPYRRRRRFKRKPITYSQIGSKIVRDVAWLKSVINVEYKYHDNSGEFVSLNTTPVFTLISGIAQGDAQTQRDGDSLRWQSILARFYVTSNPAATLQTFYRISIIYDKSPNGVAPTQLNVFETTDIQSALNVDNSSRFHILYDKIGQVTHDSASPHAMIDLPQLYKKVNGHGKFDGPTNAITNTTTGHYFLYIFGTSTANAPTLRFLTRLRYTDN